LRAVHKSNPGQWPHLNNLDETRWFQTS
jgi:hypothetical protein